MSGGQAVVVGAGIGGLATAIRLRLAGRDVTVLERRDQVGGRAGLIERDGFTFDTGPSHLMLLDPLRELFAAAGTTLEARLALTRLDPCYRVHIGADATLDLEADPEAFAAACDRLSPGSGRRALDYLALGGRLHAVGMDAVIDRQTLDWRAFLAPRHWPLLAQGVLWRSLHTIARRMLPDSRIRAALTAQSLYLGMSPAQAPALYALLPYLELSGGVYFPKGGMHALPRALAELARELGVTIRCGQGVESIERAEGRVTGVRLATGERLSAEVVVVNADLTHAYRHLLGEQPPGGDRHTHSCGAFVMLLGVKGPLLQLLHHNLFVPDDLDGAMRQLFRDHQVPGDPVVYLSAPSRTDPGLAPEGHETLFVLVPVPNQQPELDWKVMGPALESRVLDLLEARAVPGLRQAIVSRETLTPDTWAAGWNLPYGAAFGLDHRLTQMSLMRPANRHAALKNLYFVGASTHPGSGIPLVLISARLTAERIAQEQGFVPVARKQSA